jgi:TM2 domain-containing membrane protein YozV
MSHYQSHNPDADPAQPLRPSFDAPPGSAGYQPSLGGPSSNPSPSYQPTPPDYPQYPASPGVSPSSGSQPPPPGYPQPWEQQVGYQAGPPSAGGQLQPYAYAQTPVAGYRYAQPGPVQQKSRIAAGLLGIFLGALGIHNFYLGRTAVGVIQLLITLLSLGMLAIVVEIWALIEGIMILAGAGRFRTDARGVPLRD